MLVTLISQPHLGQGRRVIACLVWMAGRVSGIGREIPLQEALRLSGTARPSQIRGGHSHQRPRISRHSQNESVQYCSTPSSHMLPEGVSVCSIGSHAEKHRVFSSFLHLRRQLLLIVKPCCIFSQAHAGTDERYVAGITPRSSGLRLTPTAPIARRCGCARGSPAPCRA
jgi:hypothetical protein